MNIDLTKEGSYNKDGTINWKVVKAKMDETLIEVKRQVKVYKDNKKAGTLKPLPKNQ